MDIKINKGTVIVFDLDDTLFNELDYLISAYQNIAKQINPNNWKQLFATMFSLYRRKKNVFDILSSQYGVEKKELIDMYRYHSPTINLFPGVIDILEAIKNRQGKLGIISDGRSKTQRAKLKSLGVYDFFDKIIISEEIGSEKPDINNFRLMESAISGSNYWYLADNLKKDFISPNKLGWSSVGLLDSGKNIHYYSSNYMIESHMPMYFILSYEELNII